MKFELKDYQEEAVGKVLQGLRLGSNNFKDEGVYSAVSLSAPTGSGKTVIAAAAIEQVFFGDSEGSQMPDPDAVFVWLTDDPSLNQQTRKKILEASERIQPGQLVIVDEGFDQPEFDFGKVYFLNIQRLSRTSNLVKTAEGGRKFRIWDTITNAIKSNGEHYFLVRDEAHRGARKRPAAQTTIAQKLVSGDKDVSPSPVVLGISATPDRFDEEMAAANPERTTRKVSVPVEQVKESGLIKDVLSILHRGEEQTMVDTLVRNAIQALKAADEAWDAYTEKEGEPPVRPAMVIQIAPDGEDVVAGILDVCAEEWGILQGDAIAHSLQSHTAEEFGSHAVQYVAPQDIQDHPSVRVVLFKEALTTGWDCPRSEVMLSLRVAKDDTYIAQLIGRMVRSPLARRIESDESLNRVLLYLPKFNTRAVLAVKEKLEKDPDGPPTEVVVNAIDAPRNPDVPDAVFTAIESLTSYVVPGPVHRSQVTRLHRLAALLVGDGLLDGAIRESDDFLVSVMEAERMRLDSNGTLASLVNDAETAIVSVAEGDVYGSPEDASVTTVEIETDIGDVDRMFRSASQRFRDGLADTYWGKRITSDGDDPFDAKILTIALSKDPDAVEKVEKEAQARVNQWLSTHGDAISTLSEDKKAKYAEIRSMARDPEVVHPGLPEVITMPSDEDIRSHEKHVFADSSGAFRTRMGRWEDDAMSVEEKRPGFVAWYRNPTGGQRALRIPFDKAANQFGKMYPDFLVFHEDEDGKIRTSIVDPHGHHLADAASKLRGLAAYAENHGKEYQRIIRLIKPSSGDYRMLDMTEASVRKALRGINTQEEIEALFLKHGAVYK